MLGGELDGIEGAQNFVEVAAGAHGIAQGQLDLLVGTDDKDGPHGGVVVRRASFGGGAAFGGQHVVELGDFEIGIANHGVVDFVALGFFDVGGPLGMAGHRIHANAEDFGVALGELGLQSGHVTEFGGADRSEVFGMGEQDRPAVADPVVKVDGALGGFGGEVGGNIVDA